MRVDGLRLLPSPALRVAWSRIRSEMMGVGVDDDEDGRWS